MRTPLQRLKAYHQPFLGAAELAQVLGISKQALHNRLARGRLPEPQVKLAMGPVWAKAEIADFVAAYSLVSPRVPQ